MRALEYWRRNYHGTLRPGGGLEEIFAILRRISTRGLWYDLGAGPFSSLWSLGLTNITSLVAMDIDPEALMIANSEWDHFLADKFVASLCRLGLVSKVDVSRARRLRRTFLVNDCLRNQFLARADLVTSFGLAGLITDLEELTKWLVWVSSLVARRGTVFGASWVRRRGASALQKLGKDGIIACLVEAGLSTVSCSSISLSSEDFSQIVTWKGQRP